MASQLFETYPASNNATSASTATNKDPYVILIPVTATVNGVLQSLSVNLQSATGNILLSLYSNNGSNGGNLLAATASTSAVVGWNTIAPLTNPSIVAGTSYFIGVQVSSNSTAISWFNVGANAPGNIYEAQTYASGALSSISGTLTSGLYCLYATVTAQYTQTVNVGSSASIVSVRGIAKTLIDACSSSTVALKSVGKNVSDVCASSIVALKSVGKNVSDVCASSATTLASKTTLSVQGSVSATISAAGTAKATLT